MCVQCVRWRIRELAGLIVLMASLTDCTLWTDGMTRTPGLPTLHGDLPLIFGHRGASGYLPEHTLAAYRLAIEQGADFIEPDLVTTRDGVLIARHEVNITDTTDVAKHPEFAARKTTKIIDGKAEHGWFADDFTLAEIRTLWAKQRLPLRPGGFDDRYGIPTFQEIIDLAQAEARIRKRPIGLYPETKHPIYHQAKGLELESRLVDALEKNGLNKVDAPVFIQSFETANLKQLRTMTPVRLIQLVDALDLNADGSVNPGQPYDFVVAGDPRTNADLLTTAGLAEIATYADGVSPWKRYIVGARRNDDGGERTVGGAGRRLLPPTDLITKAHAAGLLVHTWTMRDEPGYLAADYRGDPLQEYLQFYCLGVDGVFSDFPDTAVSARQRLIDSPGLCSRR